MAARRERAELADYYFYEWTASCGQRVGENLSDRPARTRLGPNGRRGKLDRRPCHVKKLDRRGCRVRKLHRRGCHVKKLDMSHLEFSAHVIAPTGVPKTPQGESGLRVESRVGRPRLAGKLSLLNSLLLALPLSPAEESERPREPDTTRTGPLRGPRAARLYYYYYYY